MISAAGARSAGHDRRNSRSTAPEAASLAWEPQRLPDARRLHSEPTASRSAGNGPSGADPFACSTWPWPFPLIISLRTRAIRTAPVSMPALALQFMTKRRDTPIDRAISPGLARPTRIRWSARARIGCEALGTTTECYRIGSIRNAPMMLSFSEQRPMSIAQRFQRAVYKPRAAQ